MNRLHVLIFTEDLAELKRWAKDDKMSIARQVRIAVHSYVKHRKHWESTYERQEKCQRK